MCRNRDKPPFLFFPELLDKIYAEMRRASDHKLKANVKKKMLNDAWQAQVYIYAYTVHTNEYTET